MRMALAAVLALMLAGCVEGGYVERRHGYYRERAVVVAPAPQPVYVQPAPVYAQPAPPPGYVAGPPVVVQPAPVVYEEGGRYNGVVIVEPVGVTDYVFMNGGYYYWHPGMGVWVHARRPEGWRPGGEVHVYHSWAEHPVYHHDADGRGGGRPR